MVEIEREPRDSLEYHLSSRIVPYLYLTFIPPNYFLAVHFVFSHDVIHPACKDKPRGRLHKDKKKTKIRSGVVLVLPFFSLPFEI
jgi:hypothetical protein